MKIRVVFDRVESEYKGFAETDEIYFMKSARVIGNLNQYIGDQFVKYRVRHLIMNGVFEIEGIPKAMRFYSVKLG